MASSIGSEQAAKYFDPAFQTREAALRLLNDNRISALVVIPQGFTSAFFQGTSARGLELIKNPAQRFLPAIVEELLRLVVESLNAVSQNLTSEFPAIVEVFEEEKHAERRQTRTDCDASCPQVRTSGRLPFSALDQLQLRNSRQPGRSGRRLQCIRLRAARDGGYVSVVHCRCRDPRPYREKKSLTLMRYRTVRYHLFPFVVSKGIYSLAVMLVSAAILMIGGGTIFRIRWQHPWEITVLILSYCIFCVGFMGLVSSLFMREEGHPS